VWSVARFSECREPRDAVESVSAIPLEGSWLLNSFNCLNQRHLLGVLGMSECPDAHTHESTSGRSPSCGNAPHDSSAAATDFLLDFRPIRGILFCPEWLIEESQDTACITMLGGYRNRYNGGNRGGFSKHGCCSFTAFVAMAFCL